MFKFDDTLMNFIRRDLEQGIIPMLLGEPGIGKSSWLTNLANLMRTKCFTLPCNQLADKADLTGARMVPVMDASGNITSYKQVFYPHAVIHDAIEYARANPRETPILFLDELNRTTPDVTSEALSIPTMRSIGSVSLPDNLRVVIAGNDKGNVTTLDSASVSRFALYNVKPDTATFLSLDDSLNVFVKNVLQKHPEVIFCKTIREDPDAANASGSKTPPAGGSQPNDMDIEDLLEYDKMEQLTTPRTISAVSRWLNTFTNNDLIAAMQISYTDNGENTNALEQAIIGHVGNTAFARYLLSEIADGCNNHTNNQANSQTIIKPDGYDALKAAPTVDVLNGLIAGMTDKERSVNLLYALYEHADNDVVVQCLANHVPMFTSTDMQLFVQLYFAGKLDTENVNALMQTGTKIATALQSIVSIA